MNKALVFIFGLFGLFIVVFFVIFLWDIEVPKFMLMFSAFVVLFMSFVGAIAYSAMKRVDDRDTGSEIFEVFQRARLSYAKQYMEDISLQDGVVFTRVYPTKLGGKRMYGYYAHITGGDRKYHGIVIVADEYGKIQYCNINPTEDEKEDPFMNFSTFLKGSPVEGVDLSQEPSSRLSPFVKKERENDYDSEEPRRGQDDGVF